MKQAIPRASFGQRLLAKVIDGIVMGCIAIGSQFLDARDKGFSIFSLIGLLLAIAYMLLADGFHGQSIGKRLVRIQVINFRHGTPCTFAESIVRNAGGFGLLRIFTMLEDEMRSDEDEYRGTIVVRK